MVKRLQKLLIHSLDPEISAISLCNLSVRESLPTELGNAANRKLENHESTVFGIIDERFDGQFLNAFSLFHPSRGDICVNVMLKVLVLFVTAFGLFSISIPLAFAGYQEDYEIEPIFQDSIQRSLPANPSYVLDIADLSDIAEYEIGVIVQAPMIVQRTQAVSLIGSSEFEDYGFEDESIFQTPELVRGLQPLEDLEEYL